MFGSKLLSSPMKIIIGPRLVFPRRGNCYGGRTGKGGCGHLSGRSECKHSWAGEMLVQGFVLRL